MTTDIVEGEVRALAVRPEAGITATGTLALAALSDEEFDRRLDALRKGADRIARIQRALMEKDVDYGVIPGTKKPTLLKPGAEKLCLAYSLAADFVPARTLGDGETAPSISYLTRCQLHLGDLDGPVVAVGYGAANSWEVRYRYRKAERVCPKCGVAAIIKGKAEYGGGWLCWKKRDGCDAKFPDGSPEIEGQETGTTDNPDPWDLDVTLAKMAEKRAHIDATLRATGASALFTQDIEERRPPDPDPSRVDHETGEILPARQPKGNTKSFTGMAVTWKQANRDGEVRMDPDDIAHYGFILECEDDKKRHVDIEGDLAIAVAMANPIGKVVKVTGAYRVEDLPKKDGGTYKAGVIYAQSVTAPDGSPLAEPANNDGAGPTPDAAGALSTEPTAQPSAPSQPDELDQALERVPAR